MNSRSEYLNLFDSIITNTFQYIEVWIPLLAIYLLAKRFISRESTKKYGFFMRCLKLFAHGSKQNELPTLVQSPQKQSSNVQNIVLFMICFIGLQLSFLVWGLMQERIIKYDYKSSQMNATHPTAKFKNTQFLVLCNRLCGFVLSTSLILIFNLNNKFYRRFSHLNGLGSIKDCAPLFICSYSSLSNVFSSWFQYEALKYVNFTTQLLAKSSKSVFVMIIGRAIGNKNYTPLEYTSVAMITLGLYLFSDIDKLIDEQKDSLFSTTLPGLLCLLGYLISDSFTSTWQDKVLKQFTMSSMSLMCITNVYSSLFTFFGLLNENGLKDSLEFMREYPLFRAHVILLSLAASIGQVFIFMTIDKYGALVFTLIMTTRQVLSILLSCIFFGHHMSSKNILGTCIIFTALFVQQIPKLISKRKQKQQP